jgi:hypothetical protein
MFASIQAQHIKVESRIIQESERAVDEENLYFNQTARRITKL